MSKNPLNLNKSNNQYTIRLINKLLFNNSKLKTDVLSFANLLGTRL